MPVMAMLLVAFVVVPMFATPYAFSAILIPFLIFALATLGLNILTGCGLALSLGTAAFMAAGAFASYNFMLRVEGMPILVAFILGGICAAMVGHCVRAAKPAHSAGSIWRPRTLATQFFVVWCLTKVPYGSPTTVLPALSPRSRSRFSGSSLTRHRRNTCWCWASSRSWP